MKYLILIRHAKSEWGDTSFNDFDRPLNERGKRDAPEMANRLAEKKISIDAFFVSPAKRAAKTAKAFAEVLDIKKKNIIFKEELYLASPSVFYDAIFSHNEGITYFANQLTDARIDNIPTCGVFAIKVNCDKWKDFKEAKKEFWFFDYPKSS